MIYEESLSYIHSLLKFGIRPGLERMDTLLNELENPQKKLRFVHVAGTNGKGSVSTAISNVLVDAGYNVGLYTSPYVSDFLERIQFNGKPVDKNIFVDAVQSVKNVVDRISKKGDIITEFEALTAAAFICFSKLECDIVVLEVGLGGRLDATNIIDVPLVNVITSLSLDHTNILGDTLSDIAYEKCGTIKENGSVILSAGQYEEARCVVEKTAESRHNDLVIPDLNDTEIYSESIFGTKFRYKDCIYSLKMPGRHQIVNMISVVEACNILSKKDFIISRDNICHGINNTVLPARCEVISSEPLVILDGGHNEDGAKSFYELISHEVSEKNRLIVIAGMMADKAVEKSLKPLIKLCDRFIAVTPQNPRAMNCEELAQIAVKYCENVTCIPDVRKALEDVSGYLRDDDILCVVGSLYLAGEARNSMLQQYYCKG